MGCVHRRLLFFVDPASIEKKIAESLGVSVVIKHKKVQKATRNAAVLTMDYKSRFHKSASSKDGKEKDLPFADHYLCRPNDKANMQEFLLKQFKRGGDSLFGYRNQSALFRNTIS